MAQGLGVQVTYLTWVANLRRKKRVEKLACGKQTYKASNISNPLIRGGEPT